MKYKSFSGHNPFRMMTQELRDDCILEEWGNKMSKSGNPEYMSEKRLLAAILAELQEINKKLRDREKVGEVFEIETTTNSPNIKTIRQSNG